MEGVQVDFLRKLVDGEKALRIWLFASLICNMGIVVTGAVVRLTASGLGCSTWPKCTEESYVPHEASGIHGLIEFGNRTLTFVLIIAALGAFIAAWRNRGPRTKLWWITLGIGIGIPFQGVIGGVTVLTQLNPFVVALHLMLSVALIVICVWSLQVASGRPAIMVNARQRTAVIATFAACMLATWIGTVVTGSGPHSGDALIPNRTGFDPKTVSWLHADLVMLFCGLVIATLATVVITATSQRVKRSWYVVLAVTLAQGVIGYAQYFTGLPVLLVLLHMLGATLLVVALTRGVLDTRSVAV